MFIFLMVSCTNDINYNQLIEEDGMTSLLTELENASMNYEFLEMTTDTLSGKNTNIGLLEDYMLEVYEYDDEMLEREVNAISRVVVLLHLK